MSVWCVIASGPSLVPEDVEAVRGRARVLAVNDAYRLAPWADAVYAADLKWWHKHFQNVAGDFDGRMYTIEEEPKNPRLGAQLYGLKVYRQEPDKNKRHEGLSRRRGYLRLGGLSGYQALNLVYQWGAKVILLLGYDLQATGGKLHWFGNHPKGLTNSNSYHKRIPHFETIDPAEYGIQIINCSRETALNHFPRMPIGEALERFA